MTLKTKIVLLWISSLFILGIFASGFFYFYTNNRLNSEYISNFEKTATDLNKEVNHYLGSGRKVAQDMQDNFHLVNYLGVDKTYTKNDVLHDLYLYRVILDRSDVYIIDTSGETVVSTNPSFEGENYSFRQYYQEAIGGNCFETAAKGVTSNEAGYYFSCPIISEDDEVVGVGVIKMYGTVLEDVVDNLYGIFEGEEFLVTNSDGIVITSTDPDKLFKFIGEVNDVKVNELVSNQVISESDVGFLDYQEFQNLILSDSNKLNSRDFIDDRVSFVQSVPDFPFYTVASFRINYFDSAFGNTIYSATFIILMLVVLLTIPFLIFLNRFLMPLTELTESLTTIKAGNWGTKLSVGKAEGELGSLAKNYNEMIDRVRRDYEGIVDKLKEKSDQLDTRVKELEKVNALMVGRELKMKELKEKLKKEQGNKE